MGVQVTLGVGNGGWEWGADGDIKRAGVGTMLGNGDGGVGAGWGLTRGWDCILK